MPMAEKPLDTRVEFAGADGTHLVGTLSVHASTRHGDTELSQRTFPPHCVILLHGGMGHRDYLYHKQLTAEILSAYPAQVCVFRFDYNGNGDSQGGRFFLAGFKDDLADIRAAMSMLMRSPYDTVPICLVGHSVGAQHVLQLATESNGNIIQRSARETGYHSTCSASQIPPLLVCVQPRFRVQWWYEEWERQSASSADRNWTMKWKSRGSERSYVIKQEDVETYAAINLQAISCVNNPTKFGPTGKSSIQILSVHGIVPSNQDSSAATVMGYGTDGGATIDGVVPVGDCTEVANRVNCDRHTLKLVRFFSFSSRVITVVDSSITITSFSTDMTLL